MPREKKQLLGIPNRKWGWLIWLLLISFLGLAAYFYQTKFFHPSPQDKSGQAPKHEKGATPVIAATAQTKDIPIYLNGLGTVTGLRTVTVKSRVAGELVNVAYKEGQMVQTGELLAEIDPRAYQVQLQQAQGQLQRDEALLKNAEIDWARYKTLLEQDSISVQQTATQAALVKQYQGSVAIDRAAVANAQLQLSYTKITAPISGRLGLRLVDQGNMINANDTGGLAVITQIQPIAVIFTLPEDALPKLMQRFKADPNLTVEAYDRSGLTKLAEGHLLAVDNQIDLTTGTVKLKSQFANTDAALFANQFVNVKLRVDTLKSVVVIPPAALQNGVNGEFVFVVNNDHTVSLRNVKSGQVTDDQVVILQGLKAEEQVVIDGVDKLREGGQIKLITPNLANRTNPSNNKQAKDNHAKTPDAEK